MYPIETVLCQMRQKNTPPMQWVLASVTARVFDTKHLSIGAF